MKDLHRRHPAYNGLAGLRDQILYFEMRVSPASGWGADLEVSGTLGSGTGHEETGGRLTLELTSASKGWFVPFDSIRIRQEAPDQEGRIREAVELFSRKNAAEVPIMRMEETGQLFRPAKSS